jgi:N-acetylneuraminic acid mutarotase
MSISCWGSAAVLLSDGKVFSTGGGQGGLLTFANTQYFDPATSSWTPTADMSRQRVMHSAFVLPTGQVLVVGGLRDSAEPAHTIAELYDPASTSWTDTAPMSISHTDGTATLLGNGQVLVVGGSVQRGSPALATAELFDYVGNPH